MAKKYKGLVYEDAAGEWRWKLVAPNGNNIANAGEGYKNKGQAKKMLVKVTSLLAGDLVEFLVEAKAE